MTGSTTRPTGPPAAESRVRCSSSRCSRTIRTWITVWTSSRSGERGRPTCKEPRSTAAITSPRRSRSSWSRSSSTSFPPGVRPRLRERPDGGRAGAFRLGLAARQNVRAALDLADHGVDVPEAVGEAELVRLLAELRHVPVRIAEEPRCVQEEAARLAGRLLRVLAPVAADHDSLVDPEPG